MTPGPKTLVVRPPSIGEDPTAYDEQIERLMRESYDRGNARYVGSEQNKRAQIAADEDRYNDGLQRLVAEHGQATAPGR